MFNFSTFKLPLRFASSIYDNRLTLKETKKDKYEMLKKLKDVEKCNPKNLDKINSRKEILINADKLYNNRKNVIKESENSFFPFKDGF